MGTASIAELLAEWRAAERRWERRGDADEVRAAALEVIRAWTAYQDASIPGRTGEFMLVVDDEQTYVAATTGVTHVLGYAPDELIGRHIADVAAPDLLARSPEQWAEFLEAGRQDGRYRLRAKDGKVVALQYQARAHHPVPGFHLSRLWPDEGGVT